MTTDYASLRLRAKGDPARLDDILQAECREKTAVKLAKTLSSIPAFRFPSLSVAEMATSDEVASIHVSFISPGEKVLDMTLGLGIDAFALARKASEVKAFDIVEANVKTGRHNAAAAALTNIDIEQADSVEWLRKNPDARFDTIFIDPARRDGAGRHFRIADCAPDLTQCLPLLRERASQVIVKLSPMLDIKAALAELHLNPVQDGVKIVIIGTRKECKELVFRISGQDEGRRITPRLRAVTVGEGEFDVELDETNDARAEYSEIQAGEWLLEPYPAVMKACLDKHLCSTYGVRQIHPNTHLFTSPTIPAGFPGTAHHIDEIIPFKSSLLKTFSRKYPRINVATRNFPLRAPELAKKLKVVEGGDQKLFGLTSVSGERLLAVTSPPEAK